MDDLLKSYPQRYKLKPLCELGRNDLEYLFDNASVWPLQPHTLVTPEDGSVLYLLEGEISLLSGGFVVEKFDHTEKRGLQPLFDEIKEEDSALLTSHGAVLEIDKGLFEGLYLQVPGAGKVLTEDELQREQQRLFDQLLQDFQQNQLQLPVLPEAALKIRQVINQPDVGSAEIIKIVQTDPVLSARLIKVANSPLYGTWREIKTVRDAVRRLGQEATRSLSFSLSLSQLFHARSSFIKQQIEQIYDEGIQVSSLAYVIARNCASHLDPEQALLGGLLHNLGAIPILKYVDEHPGMVSDTRSLSKSLANLCVPVSRLMFEHWHFDAELLDVVESSGNWNRNTGKVADYVDIVIAARIVYLKNIDQLDEAIIIDTLPVVEKLGLFKTDDDGLYFFEQAKQEIADMQRVLRV
ncbi:MAG: HDOD domain-containing protein [Gammaproteobacteria bacterium]|nr:HDOD domain-containing protein [Gammaproteobacteria bacterium]